MKKKIIKTDWKALENMDWNGLQDLISPSIKVLWPNTQECLVGLENFMVMQKSMPGSQKMQMESYYEYQQIVVTEMYVHNQIHVNYVEYYLISFFSFDKNKIIMIREYQVQKEAPLEWRKDWVSSKI